MDMGAAVVASGLIVAVLLLWWLGICGSYRDGADSRRPGYPDEAESKKNDQAAQNIPDVNVHRARPGHYNRAARDKNYQKRINDRCILKIINAAAGIAVICYTGLTYRLLVAQQIANRTAQDNFIYSNRASVTLADASWVVEQDGIALIPRWENTGNIATRNMRAHVNWRFDKDQLPATFSYIDFDPDGPIIPLGPKGHTGMTFVTVPQQCIADLATGKFARLTVWGWSAYQDGMSTEERHIRFCWEIQTLAIKMQFNPGDSADVTYKLCAEGNCIDNECPAAPQHPVDLPKPYMCSGTWPAPPAP